VRSLVLDTSVAIAWYLPEAFATAERKTRPWVVQLGRLVETVVR